LRTAEPLAVASADPVRRNVVERRTASTSEIAMICSAARSVAFLRSADRSAVAARIAAAWSAARDSAFAAAPAKALISATGETAARSSAVAVRSEVAGMATERDFGPPELVSRRRSVTADT
jgi:hypothetical protein